MFCCDNNNCKEIKEYCRRHVHEALEKRVNEITRKVKVLSLPETIKEKSKFRAKAFVGS